VEEPEDRCLTCGTCRHWHRLPANPGQLGTVRGECRESPPAATTIAFPNGKGGLQVVGVLTQYPPLSPDNKACSRHEERKELKIWNAAS
jgi:hypothetical protein